MSVILEKRSNGVATVTIDRPDVLNALDVPTKQRLGEIVERRIASNSHTNGAGREVGAAANLVTAQET